MDAVQCKTDNQIYAVKMSKNNSTAYTKYASECPVDSIRNQLIREVETMEKVGRNKNIVKIYKAWEEEDSIESEAPSSSRSFLSLAGILFQRYIKSMENTKKWRGNRTF